MKKTNILVLLLLLMPLTVLADGNNYGSGSYLFQGVGSRATGMGGAFVALADDATAGYWNPAGLGQMDLYMYQAGMQYAFLDNNMSSSYLTYAFQVPTIGCFSISWINFGISGLEGRDENGEVAADFGSSENTFLISYGRKFYKLVKGLSLGASLKILYHGLGDYSAVGQGLDIGALWQPVLYWEHTIGLNIQNLFQQTYWSESDAVDHSLVNVKLGAALRFLPSQDAIYFNHLVTTIDFEFSEHHRFNFRLGTEYWYLKSIGARAGYNGREITAGASYRPEIYEVDYAFHYDLTELAAHQHRITVLLRFK